MRFTQVPRERFPNGGLPMAQVAVAPADLAARFGVVFERGQNNLDDFLLAAFALPDGSQAWLIRHVQATEEQNAGMHVIADASHQPSILVRLVVEALDLVEDELLWALADELRGSPQGFY
jgi:hypothetical protein